MALEKSILELDKKTKKQVKETLRSIEIALKLNSAKLKSKKIPPDLKRLMDWKGALEGWEKKYSETATVLDMAEGLGAYSEICIELE